MKVSDNIKNGLKKNDIVYSIYRSIKYKGFREWLKLYGSPNVLYFQKLGEENPDVPVYLIELSSKTWGFFAYWKFSVQGLAYADKYHLVPTIIWTEECPYYQKGWNQSENVWEYYFEPVSGIPVDKVKKSEQVVISKKTDILEAFSDESYLHLNEMVKEYTRYNKKYVRIREEIRVKINQDIEKLLQNKKTIAVHVRGVEWGHVKGHPEPLQLSEYYGIVDSALADFGFEQIFLATDSEDTVVAFKKKYGDKVVTYTDVLRSSEGSKTLVLFDPNVTRENNQFLMGYEVLRDMMTMAASEGLVAGYSNVSLAARVFKASQDQEYDFLHIFDNQKIVRHGVTTDKAIKLMKKNKF